MLLHRRHLLTSLMVAITSVAICGSNVRAEKYEEWLKEEVPYLIAGRERSEFAALSTDSERDAFIERFWQMRDPDPSTEENEFLVEHRKRVRYANERFYDGRPGWKTDRGRIYIIHGPPDEISFVFGGNRLRLNIQAATQVLSGGVTDGRGSFPVEFPRPEAEIWVYNRLEGSESTSGIFQIIFARVDPSHVHFLHQVIRKVSNSPNPSYPARVQRDSAIMNFLRSRRIGGEFEVLYAGEYKYPDLDTFYESIFHPNRPPAFSVVDYQQAMKDLDRSSGEILYERMERKRRLRELVQSRLSYSRFDLDVFFGSVRAETGRTLLPITLGVDAEHQGDTLEVLIELVRPDGSSAASFVDEVEIGREGEEEGMYAGKSDFLYQTRLSAQPGRYRMVIFARLRDGQAAAFEERDVLLDDYSKENLSVSDVLLFQRVIPRSEYSHLRSPVDSQFLGGSRPLLLKDHVLIPSADVRFRRREKLTAFFEVYNPEVATDTKEPSLDFNCHFWQGGQRVGSIPAKHIDYLTDSLQGESGNPHTTYGLSIPLGSFDPGNYSFEVEVYDRVANESVSSRTAFTIY